MFEVSIIIPVHNAKEQLARAIESAVNQKKVFTEVILVDDGSTDGSAEICDDYAEQEPLLIKVIHQANKGTGAALNAGLDQAIGKYVYFADPNDYFDKNLLADNCRLSKETRPDLIVFGYTQESTSNPQDRELKLPNFPQLTTRQVFRQHFGNVYQFSPFVLWNKIYNKAFLNKHHIRFTNQPIGQDALFNIDVYKHASSVIVNRKAYYHNVLHECSPVDRYHPERYVMEQKIAQAFEVLVKQWGEEPAFDDLIGEEYFRVIYLETGNLVHESCPLDEDEKVARLRRLWQTIGTEKVLPFKERDHNPFRQLLLNAYKQENFRRALFLMKGHNRLVNRYRRTHSLMNVFFNK